MPINPIWLVKFTATFEQQIEGEDGAAVGRQLWQDQDDNWREARMTSVELACQDATAEAEAWDEIVHDDGTWPLCGKDGGTGCGMPACQY